MTIIYYLKGNFYALLTGSHLISKTIQWDMDDMDTYPSLNKSIKKVKELAQGHRVYTWQSQDSDSGLHDFKVFSQFNLPLIPF